MQTDKVSVVVPCLFLNDEYVDMTATCLKGLKGLEVILIAADRGYPENVNRGLLATSGDYIIICNNDIEFIQPDWLDHLLQPLKDGCDISSIRTTDSDGWDTEEKYEYGAKFGSLWAMTRDTYEKLGPLNESFGKGYFEDLDYWRRAQDAGLKVVKNHAGLVEHAGQSTFKELPDASKIYNGAMLKYVQAWPDAVLFMQGDGIVMADKYDYQNYSDAAKKLMYDNQISIERAKELWGL